VWGSNAQCVWQARAVGTHEQRLAVRGERHRHAIRSLVGECRVSAAEMQASFLASDAEAVPAPRTHRDPVRRVHGEGCADAGADWRGEHSFVCKAACAGHHGSRALDALGRLAMRLLCQDTAMLVWHNAYLIAVVIYGDASKILGD
jgi:hypothetical protein